MALGGVREKINLQGSHGRRKVEGDKNTNMSDGRKFPFFIDFIGTFASSSISIFSSQDEIEVIGIHRCFFLLLSGLIFVLTQSGAAEKKQARAAL